MIKIRLGLCVMMMLTFVFSSLISLAPRYEYLAQILVDVNAEDGEQDSISHTSPETYGPRMELPPVVLPDGNDIESIATRAAYAHFRPYEKNGIVILVVDVIDIIETDLETQMWACIFVVEYVRFGDKLFNYMSGTPNCLIEFTKSEEGYTLMNFSCPFEGFQRDEFLQNLIKTNPSLVEKIDSYTNNKWSRIYLQFDAITAYLKHYNLEGISVELNDGTFKGLT